MESFISSLHIINIVGSKHYVSKRTTKTLKYLISSFFYNHYIIFYRLLIRIEKIEGLAPKGPDRSKYDCIVKLTILPHEKHIKYSKTIPAHSTLDLQESFIFSVKEPTKKVLR